MEYAADNCVLTALAHLQVQIVLIVLMTLVLLMSHGVYQAATLCLPCVLCWGLNMTPLSMDFHFGANRNFSLLGLACM